MPEATRPLTAALLVLCCCATASGCQAPGGADPVADVFERVHRSVVTVHTIGPAERLGKPGEAALESGVGSGVLISADGRILTAAHVVQTADQVAVEFVDGTALRARVVSSLPLVDLALVQLTEPVPAGAVVARLGTPAKARTGSQVLVVGAPLGIGHTLTVGHVSAQRTLPIRLAGAHAPVVIQTDAAISTGNSGGPLFDLNGEVLGIVSYIVSRTGGSEGLGFAVSVDTAREVLLDRAPFWSGLDHIVLQGALAEAFNLPEGRPGLLVQRVAKGSPGDRLGIQGGSIPATIAGHELLIGGDVVVACLGVDLRDEESVAALLERASALKPDDLVTVAVWRAGRRVELKGRYADLIAPDKP